MQYVDAQHHFLPVISRCLLLLGCWREIALDGKGRKKYIDSDVMIVGKNCELLHLEFAN